MAPLTLFFYQFNDVAMWLFEKQVGLPKS